MPVQTQMQVRRGTASSWTSTNPTLAAGELGFETDTGKFKIGTGASTWTALLYAGGGQSSLTTYQYTATAGQTTFSGADVNSNTLSYTVGAIQVYLNGALLANTTDYAATNGTSVVLTGGAGLGDSLTIISFATFDVANTYTQAQADALFIADTIVDAKGDLIAGTAADTVARLAVGANDTILTADSSTATGLKWAAPSGGGVSFTQLSSVTTTGGSTISFTGLSSYNTIMLRWNVLSSTNDSRFLVGVNSDTTNANTWSIEARQNGTSAYGETYGGRINLTGYALATAGSNSSGMLLINNCKQSTFKFFNFYGVTTGPNQITGGGYYNIGAISTLEFVASAGTIDANSGVTIWGSTI
jgi:hypothetical protein